MFQLVLHYAWGVFKGGGHSYKKVLLRKRNPLQAAACFGLKWFVFPAIWSTGPLYLSYGFGAHVKPMITGCDEIALTPAEEAYLQAGAHWRLKPQDG